MAFGPKLGASADALLSLVWRISTADGFDIGPLQADCLRLARKVSLLFHLLEEIRNSAAVANPTPPSSPVASSSSRISPSSFLADLTAALEAVERFLLLSYRSPPVDASSVLFGPAEQSSLFGRLCRIDQAEASEIDCEGGREGETEAEAREGGGGQGGSRTQGRESEAREELTRSAAGAGKDKYRGRRC